MPQLFRRWTNSAARGSILGALLALALGTLALITAVTTSYGTSAGLAPVQPIPFSHQHHAGTLGIDCRYCHTSVEHAPFAGMPPTKICMNCHSQMWVGSEMLATVRQSYHDGESIRWKRVYNTPGFVYFDHSIHVQKGMGCSSCHGRVDQMPFTYQQPTLLMQWCVDCHRNPEEHVRPLEYVFDMNYQLPQDQAVLGRELVERYGIRSSRELTSCSMCHR
jgi:hypothetical protein